MAQQSAQPVYRAYTVIKRDGEEDFWLGIGACFNHKDGKGMNLVLQALPIPDGDGGCKIVLREPQADEKPEPAPPANVADARSYRDRRGK